MFRKICLSIQQLFFPIGMCLVSHSCVQEHCSITAGKETPDELTNHSLESNLTFLSLYLKIMTQQWNFHRFYLWNSIDSTSKHPSSFIGIGSFQPEVQADGLAFLFLCQCFPMVSQFVYHPLANIITVKKQFIRIIIHKKRELLEEHLAEHSFIVISVPVTSIGLYYLCQSQSILAKKFTRTKVLWCFDQLYMGDETWS